MPKTTLMRRLLALACGIALMGDTAALAGGQPWGPLDRPRGAASGPPRSPFGRAPAPAHGRYLLFLIDRGFGNGIEATRDGVALDRIVASLRPFTSRYEVRVVINPRNADPSKNEWLMDALAARHMPFVVDVYASDTMAMGQDGINHPYDVQHGISQSIPTLEAWKARWGDYFAGVRAHELFGITKIIQTCKVRGVTWCKGFQKFLPEDTFYREKYLDQFMAFAARHDMPLFLSDPYWHDLNRGDDNPRGLQIMNQNDNETSLRRLLSRYPGTAYVMYSNNEAGDKQWNDRNIWPDVVRPFVRAGAAGFGLSDQSWFCNGARAASEGLNDTNCPIEIIADQARFAFDSGASVVEFEPPWYLWNIPKGQIGVRSNYPADPAWADRGEPTPRLSALASALGVAPN